MRVSSLAGIVLCLAALQPGFAEEKKKPQPMYARADVIDPATKSFIQKTRDGREVKHVLASSANIQNNGKSAKFEDIKVGDMVSGSRVKKSDTEYEVLKITKFGPRKAAEPKQ